MVPTVRRYIAELVKDSFALWEHGRKLTSFAGIVLGSILLGVLLILGLSITFEPAAGFWVSTIFLLWLLFLLLLVSPYRIWRSNNVQICDLKERFKPRLRLSFGKDVAGCYRPTEFTNGPSAIFFRVKAEYLGTGSLNGCTGYLTDVKKDGMSANFGESLQLTFALAEMPDTLSKTIVDKVPQYLDVGFVLDSGEFQMATKDRVTPNSLRHFFSSPGDYGLRVVVASSTEDIPSESIDLVLHLTGDWKTTEMEQHKEDT